MKHKFSETDIFVLHVDPLTLNVIFSSNVENLFKEELTTLPQLWQGRFVSKEDYENILSELKIVNSGSKQISSVRNIKIEFPGDLSFNFDVKLILLKKGFEQYVECIFEKSVVAESSKSKSHIDYESLFNSTKGMIFIIDAEDFAIEKLNSVVEKKLGFKEEELLNTSFLNLFALNSITEVVSNLESVKEKKEKVSNKLYLQKKDKSNIIGSFDFALIEGKAGEKNRISCIARDVTKIKYYEKQVAQLDRLLKIMKSVNHGIVEKNSIEDLIEEIVKILSLSDIFSSVWIAVKTQDKVFSAERGYKKKINIIDEIISREMRINCIEKVNAFAEPQFIHSPESECLGCPYKDFYTGNGTLVLPLKYEEKDYGYLNVGLSYDFVLGEEEKQFLMEIANDIAYAVDNLIKDEKERQYQHELIIHNTALEAAANGILITDINGKIIYVNNAFSELTGYAKEEVIGKNPSILKSNKNPVEYYKDLWDTILSGRVWRKEIINVRKDGTEYYEDMTITPVKNAEGEIVNFIAIKQDITERKRIENELVKAKEEAERSNKLKSEFLAQISHEIRTPINVLLSYSSLIESELPGDLDDDLKDSFTYMRSAGKRIVRTVDLILHMSEVLIGTYQFKSEKIDICKEVIQPVFNEYKFTAESKGLLFQFTPDEKNPQILGDSFSLQQVITNIVDNAVKYTEKGHVKIYCDYNKDKNFVLTVEDTGIGIKKEYLNDIFDLFSQEEQGYTRKFEGNGLGMALVKSYCNMNDVGIKIESEKWKGTKIILTFNKTLK